MSPYIHYDGRYKNTNSQTNSSTKYIYQIYVEVWCKMKSIVTRQWKIYILEYVLEYLIDKKERNIDNYNY